MNTRKLMLTGVAVLTALAAYAQTGTPDRPGNQFGKLTPEQRAARKAERRAKLDAMTPAERQAFKQAHRQQRQARIAAMSPEQRQRFMERKRMRKEQRKMNRG